LRRVIVRGVAREVRDARLDHAFLLEKDVRVGRVARLEEVLAPRLVDEDLLIEGRLQLLSRVGAGLEDLVGARVRGSDGARDPARRLAARRLSVGLLGRVDVALGLSLDRRARGQVVARDRLVLSARDARLEETGERESEEELAQACGLFPVTL